MKKQFLTILAIASFCFTITVSTTSCSKDDEVKKEEEKQEETNNETPDELTVDSECQFKGHFDGEAVHWINRENAVQGYSKDVLKGIDGPVAYCSLISSDDGVSYINVHFGSFYVSSDEFLSIFTTGEQTFSPKTDNEFDLYNGVAVSTGYFENEYDWIEWNTRYGDQSNSYFNFHEFKDEDLYYGHYVTFRATFKCTLYNLKGESKVVEGEYIGSFNY